MNALARAAATAQQPLQRKCACGAAKPPQQASCGECRKGQGRLAASDRTPWLQRKLQVSAPGDALEREADRAAEHVLHAQHQGFDASGTPSPMTLVQRYAAGDGTAPSIPGAVTEVLGTSGAPLNRETRAYFEPRFGHDFGRVRVHTDARAAASADAVDARAYTVGQHIVFGPSQFEPGSREGRRLLAHELAHTVQQRAAPPILAREPKPQSAAATGEELEVQEAPKSADPSEQPWFVYREPGAKSDRRSLLPKGARVQATGKVVTDVRGTQKIRLRPVRVLSLPDKQGDAAVIGRQGMVQTRYLAAVPKAAPKMSPKATEPKAAPRYGSKDFDAQRTAIIQELAKEEAARKLYAQRSMAGTVGHLQVNRGVFGNVGAGGALQVTVQAASEPVKEQMLALHEALEKLAKDIETHPLFTFLSGLVDGIRSTLSLEIFKNNAGTFAKFSVYWPLSPSLQLAFFAGTASGVKKEIEGLIDLVKDFDEVVDQVKELAKAIASEGGAEVTRAIGFQIGADAAKRLNEIGSITDLNKLSTALGETFGPLLLEIALGIATGGGSAAVSASARMASMLAKFPKLAKFLDKLKDLRKLATAGKKALPDAPKSKHLPDAPKKKPGGRKSLPDAQARELKLLSRDPKNIKPVRDQKLLDEGYDVELKGQEHTYRRRSDGSWCRFSTPECNFGLDPEDEAAIRKAAERELAVAAGWAIEDYVGGLGYTRPKAFNFQGIDGWKGGRSRGRGVIADADVIQIKGIRSLKHDNVRGRYDEGIKGLLADSWESGGQRVVSPKSRTLHLVFDQDTYVQLSPRQQDELRAVMKQLSGLKQKPPIEVQWFYMSPGGRVRIKP